MMFGIEEIAEDCAFFTFSPLVLSFSLFFLFYSSTCNSLLSFVSQLTYLTSMIYNKAIHT
jgi:hypothetical protein